MHERDLTRLQKPSSYVGLFFVGFFGRFRFLELDKQHTSQQLRLVHSDVPRFWHLAEHLVQDSSMLRPLVVGSQLWSE